MIPSALEPPFKPCNKPPLESGAVYEESRYLVDPQSQQLLMNAK